MENTIGASHFLFSSRVFISRYPAGLVLKSVYKVRSLESRATDSRES